MNKTAIRILVILLCGILLLGILAMPLSMLAAEPMYFGRTTLDSNEQYVYDQLLAGVADCTEVVELEKDRNVTIEQVSAASLALINDHPEYFWYCGDYVYTQVNQSYISQVKPTYTLGGKTVTGSSPELVTARAELANKINDILSKMTAKTEYDKVLYLHDYLIGAVEYAAGNDNQTAYGALIGGKAVCAGYTRAFQLLLNAAGIQAWKVDGRAVNAKGETEAHSWNLVWLDGKCCYFDPTWDDQGTYKSHAYFGLSLEQISADPIANADCTAVLPQCGHNDMGYHTMKAGAGTGVGILTDTTTAEELATYFASEKNAQGKDVLTCSFWYAGTEYQNWVSENLGYLAFVLDLQGEYNCDGLHMGNEYTIVFTGTVKESQLETLPELPPQDNALDGQLTELLVILAAVAVGIIVLIIGLAIGFRKKK